MKYEEEEELLYRVKKVWSEVFAMWAILFSICALYIIL